MRTEELVNGIRNKNEAAMAEAFNVYYKKAYFIARSFVKDQNGAEDLADDIVQDSFIKAFNNIGHLSTPEKFGFWFNMIVTNKAKDVLKQRKITLFSSLESEDDDTEFDPEDTSMQFRPDATVDYAETKRLIGNMIDNLPKEQRIVMVMFYFENCSVKEIARQMECPENTIKSRLNYGRKSVKEQVLDLEEKGTKLYCIPLMPFLFWLFKQEAIETSVDMARVSKVKSHIMSANAAGETAAKSSAYVKKAAGSKIAKKVGMSAVHKIIVGIVAAGCVTGAAVAGNAKKISRGAGVSENIAATSVSIISTTVQESKENATTAKETTVPVTQEAKRFPELSEAQRSVLNTIYSYIGSQDPRSLSDYIAKNTDAITKIYESYDGQKYLYDGTKLTDKVDGKGVLIDSASGVYAGNFAGGKPAGETVLVWDDGKIRFASGVWSDGTLNGNGQIGYETGLGKFNFSGPMSGGLFNGAVEMINDTYHGRMVYHFNVSNGKAVMDEHWVFNEQRQKYSVYAEGHPKGSETEASFTFGNLDSVVFGITYKNK